jgi:hypothetical protein
MWKIMLACLITIVFTVGAAYGIIFAVEYHTTVISEAKSQAYVEAKCEVIDLYYDTALYRESELLLEITKVIAQVCVDNGLIDYDDLPIGLQLEYGLEEEV